MGRFDGLVAVITGASGGIGAGTARKMAQEGAAIVIMARRKEKLDRLIAEIRQKGGTAIGLEGDLSREADCDRLIDTAVSEFGRIDILVNNAGQPDFHQTASICTDEMWESTLRIQEYAVFYCCRRALQYMEKQKSGVIVNISSICGTNGTAGISSAATKAAIIGMTKNIAMQYTGTGIRCNAIAPGVVTHEAEPGQKPVDPYELTQNKEFFEKTKRYADFALEPSNIDEQADVICFLASHESRAITGQCIMTDRGMCI